MNPADLIVVLASTFFAFLLLFNFQRQKLSYFYNVRSLFYAWCICFILIAYSRIFSFSFNSAEVALYRTKVSLIISSLMAMVFGSLAAILSHYTETETVRKFLSQIFKKPYPPLLVYYALWIGNIILCIITTPFSITQFRNLITGDVEYAAVHETWYKGVLILLGITVILYPCLTFFKLSKQHKDAKVRKSFKFFVITLILYTVSSPLFTIVRTYGYSEYDLTYLFQTFLLAMMWYGFKEPTILTGFFEKQPYEISPKRLDVSTSKASTAFSESLGLRHQQLVGRKILLEFDATTNYEEAVKEFLQECQTHDRLPIIFTRKGSVIYSATVNEKNVHFVLLTSNVSIPTQGASKSETLLPAEDISLMLNALNKMLKDKTRNMCLVYDNLSDLIFSVGFEKTYAFTKYVIEMLAGSETIALFLINPQAHDSKIVSSIRGLFTDQITYEKEQIEITKLSELNLKIA